MLSKFLTVIIMLVSVMGICSAAISVWVGSSLALAAKQCWNPWNDLHRTLSDEQGKMSRQETAICAPSLGFYSPLGAPSLLLSMPSPLFTLPPQGDTALLSPPS